MSFGAPALLPLTLLAVVAAGIYYWIFRRRRAAEARFRGGSVATLRASSYSTPRQVLKAALVVAAVALLGVAVARPRIGTHRQLLQKEGTDVIIALDVSLSMSARDANPTRLDRAKGAITALLNQLQGDRVGLVTFAGSADLRFPLTTDIEAARSVINSVTFKDGGLQSGTSIGSALRQATQGFANDQTRSKILLLVSDGEDLGDDAAQAAAFASSEGISLDTIGVGGTTPVPLMVVNPRTQQVDQRTDPTTGGPLTTTADPAALRQLASENRGRFYDGNSDDFAVSLADEIGRLEKTRFDSGEGSLPIERYQIIAALAISLLLLEYILPAGRPAWTRTRRWSVPPVLAVWRRGAPAGGPGRGRRGAAEPAPGGD